MFNFNGMKVRAMLIDCEPWFVAKDVCDLLGLEEASPIVQRLRTVLGSKNKTKITNKSGSIKLHIPWLH